MVINYERDYHWKKLMGESILMGNYPKKTLLIDIDMGIYDKDK